MMEANRRGSIGRWFWILVIAVAVAAVGLAVLYRLGIVRL